MLLVLFLVACAAGYRVMYDVFADEPVSDGEGQNVVVRVDSDMSTYDIGKRLEEEGLVENALIFTVQTKLFTEKGKSILSGTYTLNTSMNAEEMIEILVEGYEEDDTEGSSASGDL